MAAFGKKEGGEKVEAYLGLQYGSLLNGELRFMPPTAPTETWGNTIKNVDRFHAVCPQPTWEQLKLRRGSREEKEKWEALRIFIEDQDEECLRLNIYVPVISSPGEGRGRCKLNIVL